VILQVLLVDQFGHMCNRAEDHHEAQE
jgi:hypothetical protein